MMFGAFGGIIGILQAIAGFGDTVKSISGDIARVKLSAQQAQTDKARFEAEEETKTLQARRDVLIAEAPGSRMNQLLRVALSIPAVVIIWSVTIDWLLGLKSQPPTFEMWTYFWTVCGFYLMNRLVQVAKR
jgi:hypothetical protein